jgi:protein-S-isoprenylcysteine O-methyltransferase Ste14
LEALVKSGREPLLTEGAKTARLVFALIGSIVLFAVTIFWPAGRLDWVAGWLYLGLVSASFLVNVGYLRRVSPGLIEQRMRIGPGTKRWDIIWGVFFGPLMLGIYVVAGFDAVRYEWSTMSSWMWPLGLTFFVPGMALFTWSMGVNPFFEKTVRIQTERGHRVIDSGPYGFVRHPGYLGVFGWCLSAPLLLGSWWAFVPAMLSVIALVIRTALEDRTLRRELTGYAAYTKRVPYRLLTGIW